MSPYGRFRIADAFTLVNVVLFFTLTFSFYSRKFIAYRGYANITEFAIYAAVILAVILAIWWRVRALSFPAWLLIFVQIGILMHFAGALVSVDGGRLYDTHLLGIRFDKYVHATNAVAGSALVAHILGKTRSAIPLQPLVIVLTVLGAGAVVEIVEYLVSLTVPRNGVGDYDNNMQDLIANLAGTLVYIAAMRLKPALRYLRNLPVAPERA